MYLLLFISLLLLDQGSKYIIARVFPTIVIQNTGIAFSLFYNHISLIILSNVILLLLLIVLRKSIFGHDLLAKFAFVFIFAGGFGNLLDRLLLGYVLDFISFSHIPVFNLADLFINIGIFLLIFNIFYRAIRKV